MRPTSAQPSIICWLVVQKQNFGFGKPTTAADVGDNGIDRENETARQRQDLAGGLTASYVARNVAQLADMISFWPNDISYTHLIVCIEQGRSGTTPAVMMASTPQCSVLTLPPAP